jgi:hypothetical protein
MSTTSDVQETKMFQQSNSQSEELLKRNITKTLCAKQTGTQIKELLYNISITTTLSETCNKQFEEDAKEILKLYNKDDNYSLISTDAEFEKICKFVALFVLEDECNINNMIMVLCNLLLNIYGDFAINNNNNPSENIFYRIKFLCCFAFEQVLYFLDKLTSFYLLHINKSLSENTNPYLDIVNKLRPLRNKMFEKEYKYTDTNDKHVYNYYIHHYRAMYGILKDKLEDYFNTVLSYCTYNKTTEELKKVLNINNIDLELQYQSKYISSLKTKTYSELINIHNIFDSMIKKDIYSCCSLKSQYPTEYSKVIQLLSYRFNEYNNMNIFILKGEIQNIINDLQQNKFDIYNKNNKFLKSYEQNYNSYSDSDSEYTSFYDVKNQTKSINEQEFFLANFSEKNEFNILNYNPSVVLKIEYITDFRYYKINDNDKYLLSNCLLSEKSKLKIIDNLMYNICIKNKDLGSNLNTNLSNALQILNNLIYFYNDELPLNSSDELKCLYNCKYEIGSILINNLFVLSSSIVFSEIEKMLFKDIINQIYTKFYKNEEKDKYKTLNYCLINLLKMNKSIIWLLKLMTNYDVAINNVDKKVLTKCYPKTKEFLKVLDKIHVDPILPVLHTEKIPVDIEDINHDEDEDEELEQDDDEEVKTENKTEVKKEIKKEIKTEVKREIENNIENNIENESESENNVYITINGIDMYINPSFKNINITKNNGKLCVLVN